MNNNTRDRLHDQHMSSWARRRTFFMTCKKIDGSAAEISIREREQLKDLEDMTEYFDYNDKRVSER